ncbi:ferrochelatase [Parachitinimonas caeni]|uniref:Ferrochelatase n=1 Tax=Parachitinimonas caeni TaxID=3031301 RepID=A0ABT7DZE6_9NEIS|nr:ferrochelatase [Parachitinimonas caeni]MDK2125369.1 ferrochelatase [Parachitinimonas caeni]
MRYLPEPSFRHDATTGRVGILLINLGTPQAPTAAALRPYLRQFLSDPRVVEIPRLIWWPILNGFILTTRPAKSAAKYAQIWTKEGSPLAVYTQRQAKLLQGYLAELADQKLMVDYAMRYGSPSIEQKLQAMKAAGCDRILIVPLYPQYAASSSGSALDEVYRVLSHMRNPPEIRTIKHFHDHPAYINALAGQIRNHWQQHRRPDHLLMSFHGVPRYTLDKGDPYHCECHKTARLLAEALALPKGSWSLAFQSRFGRAEWLKPYVVDVLGDLGRKGTGTLDVVCPGFVSDCLETLEEIALEASKTFTEAGGKQFRYIPALNDQPNWIRALAQIVQPHLAGWENTGGTTDAGRPSRAKALGASQ